MSLVSDAHTPLAFYTPYQRPPQTQTIVTAIPRGLRSFVVPGATLAAKPSNDDILVSSSVTLPAGFGYILNEVYFNIDVPEADDYDAIQLFLLANSSVANAGATYRVPVEFPNLSNNGSGRFIRASRIPAGTLPRTPIVPGPAGAFATIRISNLQDAAQVAGEVTMLMSFFEYDLEQIQFFPVHMVSNVLGR